VSMRLVRGRDRKFYVKHQEDLYASQTLPGAFVPMVGLMIIEFKVFSAFVCFVMARIFQLLGHWRPAPSGL